MTALSLLRTRRFVPLTAIAAAVLVGCGGGGGGGVDEYEMRNAGITAANTPIAGAIFTTNEACTGVNVNRFDAKDQVYLDGGGRGVKLTNGTYYVQVTAPDGTILGRSDGDTALVTGGELPCERLVDLVFEWNAATGAINRSAPGYLDTPNPGGVYKVWISKSPDFAPNQSKTDNFKVLRGDEPPNDSGITVTKFYDTNQNGVWDEGELEILNWKVDLKYDSVVMLTPAPGSSPFGFTDQYWPLTNENGPFVAGEFRAVTAPGTVTWKAIGARASATSPTAAVNGIADLEAAAPYLQTFTFDWAATHTRNVTVAFGNVCQYDDQFRTMGFWGNKNGLIKIGTMGAESVFTELNDLGLKGKAGTPAPILSISTLTKYLRDADAKDMTYMLSAQLVAFYLNSWGRPTMVQTTNNELNFLSGWNADTNLISSADLIAAAKSLLEGTSQSGSISLRDQQRRVKDVLDIANNNALSLYGGSVSSCGGVPETFASAE